jgi:hypothetical protein
MIVADDISTLVLVANHQARHCGGGRGGGGRGGGGRGGTSSLSQLGVLMPVGVPAPRSPMARGWSGNG